MILKTLEIVKSYQLQRYYCMPGDFSNFPLLLILLLSLREINVSNSYIIFRRNVFLCCWKKKQLSTPIFQSILYPTMLWIKLKVWRKFISLKASLVNEKTHSWKIIRFRKLQIVQSIWLNTITNHNYGQGQWKQYWWCGWW